MWLFCGYGAVLLEAGVRFSTVVTEGEANSLCCNACWSREGGWSSFKSEVTGVTVGLPVSDPDLGSNL